MPRINRDDDIIRLRHMLDFATKASVFIQGKSRRDLDSDEMLALALVRLLEVIGEAANAVSPSFQEAHPEIPWRSITGTRNRLAHGYIDVDMDVIWAVIQKDLKPLAIQLRSILKKTVDSRQ
jgi:uncharacterized protein with HEPN domain